MIRAERSNFWRIWTTYILSNIWNRLTAWIHIWLRRNWLDSACWLVLSAMRSFSRTLTNLNSLISIHRRRISNAISDTFRQRISYGFFIRNYLRNQSALSERLNVRILFTFISMTNTWGYVSSFGSLWSIVGLRFIVRGRIFELRHITIRDALGMCINIRLLKIL